MDKRIIKISQDSKTGETLITIEKDFSINNVEQIKAEIEEVIEKNNSLTIDLIDIDNFDLTSIQLLYAIKKIEKKDIKIKTKIKDDLKNIVINSGFKELIN